MIQLTVTSSKGGVVREVRAWVPRRPANTGREFALARRT